MTSTKMIIPLCIAACSIATVASGQSVQGRSDSTSQATQAPYENKDDNFYRQLDEDFRPVKTDDLPERLKATLKQAQFQGWEHGEFLRSGDHQIYQLRMGAGDDSATYRFQADGSLIKPEQDRE